MGKIDHKADALDKIAKALAFIEKSQATYPNDPLLTPVQDVLNDVKDAIGKQWPLPKDYRDAEDLGVFATRNIDDIMPDLANLLYALGGAVRRGRGEK